MTSAKLTIINFTLVKVPNFTRIMLISIKSLRKVVFLILLISLSSFNGNTECQYAGSNIDFVKSQTEKALSESDMNILRYHAYKAINAIQKTEEKLSNCGCKYAMEDLEKSLSNLKLATKQENLEVARDLLSMSLESTSHSITSLGEHQFHESNDDADSEENAVTKVNGGKRKFENVPIIYKRIDESLLQYQKSLKIVVETVECKEAHDFMKNIVDQCDKELLKKTLTEGKKYYYHRTKEITAKALNQLKGCSSLASR